MRIVLMYLIISSHFVVNSGVTKLWTSDALTPNAVFLTLWGMWGKLAINAFVMVTGWFMCKARYTWQKYVKLLAQIYCLRIIGWIILIIVKAPDISQETLFRSFAYPFRNINGGFTASFLALYLLIPFLNKLIGVLDQDWHLRLVALLVGMYTATMTLLGSTSSFSEVGWYCTLYLIASYLRLYCPAWTHDHKRVSILFAFSVVLSVGSVALLMARNVIFGLEKGNPYFFVSTSGKVLALVTGVLCFLWFDGLGLSYSGVVNSIASTTFGVLLLHAHSDVMYNWLWGSFINVPGLYETCTLPQLVCWAVVVPIVVFAVCSVVELLRQRLLEPPFMRWLEAHEESIEARAGRIWSMVLRAFS